MLFQCQIIQPAVINQVLDNLYEMFLEERQLDPEELAACFSRLTRPSAIGQRPALTNTATL